jgi:hypothetical protein
MAAAGRAVPSSGCVVQIYCKKTVHGTITGLVRVPSKPNIRLAAKGLTAAPAPQRLGRPRAAAHLVRAAASGSAAWAPAS